MQYVIPPPQCKQSTDPKEYKYRIIVTGTRNWDDKTLFHETLVEYLKRFDEPVLFISKNTPTGADRFIKDWCNKFKYPHLEIPLDWSNLRTSANYAIELDMVSTASHLLCYWDMVSREVKNIKDLATQNNLFVTTIAIEKPQ
jgi:hypothetical protein